MAQHKTDYQVRQILKYNRDGSPDRQLARHVARVGIVDIDDIEPALGGAFLGALDAEIEGEQIRAELFHWLLWPALLLLLLDIGLRNTRLRRFP